MTDRDNDVKIANDQTASSLLSRQVSSEELVISQKDRDILRSLAVQMAKLAAEPVQQEKKKLWYDLNALKETRPVIFCDPENGWNEIITADQLKCEGGIARSWEMTLRKEIFWGDQMGDDKVIEPYFNIPYAATIGDWGLAEEMEGLEGHGSYRWKAPLKDYDADMPQLHFQKIEVDHQATDSQVNIANEIFGDLLTIRVKGGWWWTLGLTLHAVFLRGLETIMWDMVDCPDNLHKLMAFLRDGHLAMLDHLQENGLLSPNHDNTYVGSGGFGFSDELPQADFNADRVRTMDMWGFGESQETGSVSPDMFEEFVFQYQRPVLERFGLNCYGCCEPLDKRWHIVKKVPRLRRVSVSPWANIETMAENLGADYVYSLKPNPADLAAAEIDEDKIRKDLRRAIEVTRGCRVEIIMKDNHTIGNNPENVKKWCRIAKQEAQRG